MGLASWDPASLWAWPAGISWDLGQLMGLASWDLASLWAWPAGIRPACGLDTMGSGQPVGLTHWDPASLWAWPAGIRPVCGRAKQNLSDLLALFLASKAWQTVSQAYCRTRAN